MASTTDTYGGFRTTANGRSPADVERSIRRAQNIARWMDDRFRIPGTNRRVGLDGVLGMIPGIGDVLTTGVSVMIMKEAWAHGLPKTVIGRMGANLLIDTVVGAVPLVGDLFDFGWKANRKNAELLTRHLRGRHS